MVSGAGRQAPVPVGSRLRSARAVRPAAGLPASDSRTTSTSAKSPTRTPRSRPLLEAVRAVEPPPLLVVTADHGEARGDHGELTHGLFCYEATLHVPLFAWCPPLSSPRDGTTCPRATSTSFRRSSTRSASRRRASSRASPCWPRAARKPRPAPTSRRCRRRSTAAGRRCGVSRRGGDKYIDLPIPELYNLPADPGETKNLVAAGPDSLRRLRKRLLELPAAPTERGHDRLGRSRQAARASAI